jgi:hypothetical protein
MVTVGLASDHALQHSFSLVLLPMAQMAWLLLVAFWGTLQYKWYLKKMQIWHEREESPTKLPHKPTD